MGTPVELTYNIDVSDGLTNGVTGTLCNWSLTADLQVATLYILFSNQTCGAKARAAHSVATQCLGIQRTWTPVNRTTVQFKLSKTSSTSIQRQQFAVRVCAAHTVHRVQGQSLERALIDLQGRRQSGLHYVAMSRLITEEGMQLRNFRKRDIVACPEVARAYERLRAEASLHVRVPQLQRLGSYHFIMTTLNARSLHANIHNV